MKRIGSSLWIVAVILLSAVANAQDTATLRRSVDELNKALVAKDKPALKKMLESRLSYAHSNGWVETKKEVLHHLSDGTLIYQSIRSEVTAMAIEGNTGMVRSKGAYEVWMKGAVTTYQLKVVQIWKYKHRRWRLMGRQSEQDIN